MGQTAHSWHPPGGRFCGRCCGCLPTTVRCRREGQFRGYFKVMARCMPMKTCGMPPIFASGQKQSIT